MIVIDSSVARAYGASNRGESPACRAVLDEILNACHGYIVTPALRTEWEDQWEKSRPPGKAIMRWHFHAWRRMMLAPKEKKKNVKLDKDPDPVQLDEQGMTEEDGTRLKKDLHLIEAAYHADGVIVTLEENLKEAWERNKRRFHPRREIIWAIPGCGGLETIRALLRAGHKHR